MLVFVGPVFALVPTFLCAELPNSKVISQIFPVFTPFQAYTINTTPTGLLPPENSRSEFGIHPLFKYSAKCEGTHDKHHFLSFTGVQGLYSLTAPSSKMYLKI